MQYKGRTFCRLLNCLQLRSVNRNGQIGLLFPLVCRNIPIYVTFHKAADNLALLKSMACCMDVIPHSKLCKAEVSNHTGLDNIPSGNRKYCAPNDCKGLFDIGSVFICRERIQT